MRLREWTTDTPTPHVVRLDTRPLANEITVSVDGVVVHCRSALFGIHGGFRHDLTIDGEQWTVFAGTAVFGSGSGLVRAEYAHQVFPRWRRAACVGRICLALLLILFALSPAPRVISQLLRFDDWLGALFAQSLLAIGIFGACLSAFYWWLAGIRTNATPAPGAPAQATDTSSRSAFRCLVLVLASVALSAGAFNAKSIALYFVGNREMVPVLTAVMTALSAVLFGVAVVIALQPFNGADRRRADRRRAEAHSREKTLGAPPRRGSFFRPLLEDIRHTARRWKLGLPRFWIGRARLPR